MRYKIGQLVVNRKLGLGKVLEVSGDTVMAYFKDQDHNPRTINIAVVPMPLAESQSDEWFDAHDDLDRLRRPVKPRAKKKAAVAKTNPA